jgi:hypothetical protein
MRLLANDSLLVSALGDNFKPCSTIYISFKDKAFIQDGISLLKEHEQFSDKTFSIVTDSVKNATSSESLVSSVYIIIAMTVCLCVAVVFCCFYILSSQRAQENAVFKSVGALPWRLNILSFVEIAVYWFIGAIFALALSYPLAFSVFERIGFRFISPYYSFNAFILACVILLACALLTVTAFTLTERNRKKPRNLKPFVLITFVLFVLAFVLIQIVPKKLAFSAFMLAGTLLLLFLFLFVPSLFKKITAFIDGRFTARLINDGKSKNTSLLYALKNSQKVNVLQNTARLWVLLLTLVLSVGLSLISAEFMIADNKEYISGDFVVLGATDSCYEKIQGVDGVDGVYSLCTAMGEIDSGRTLFMFSASDVEAFNDFFSLSTLPQGNNAFISAGYARMLGLGVGDQMNLTIGDKEICVTISKIINARVNMLVFDSQNFNMSYIFAVSGVSDNSYVSNESDFNKYSSLNTNIHTFGLSVSINFTSP